MKKLFRALSLCLTLALCVSGSTAALAEAPAATPAQEKGQMAPSHSHFPTP